MELTHAPTKQQQISFVTPETGSFEPPAAKQYLL
ncbi:hypothetical protein MNBD_GAMMA13-833 [hydrothermal vent metagenome]|uniref:Uncharacterized protein n=1 Tax=hydrothermal vent metagenome TaxID=652676 RepID=A0A3B0Z2N6_9ZZZZ